MNRDVLFRGKILENEFKFFEKNGQNPPKWAVGSFHKNPSFIEEED